MNEKVTFSSLVNKVESKDLVLPDFQRKFVWDKEMMCKLFASVLCRMPLGSVLVLNSADDKFACKEIGAKKRTQEYNDSIPQGKLLSYLIDGQQRLTSLFAGFTTHFLEHFYTRPSEITSDGILEMYFLKIPSQLNNENDLDIFNVKNLQFNSTSYTTNTYFSSSIMQKLICSEKTTTVVPSVKKGLFDIFDPDKLKEVVSFCCTEDEEHFYHIPLQFINSGNIEIQSAMLEIINGIAGLFFPTKDMSKDKRNQTIWASNVLEYLKFCLSNIDLNQITVDNSDKARAIDIYSNLNLGGVSLSVFDLIMAKVGSVSSDNFYDQIVEYIQKTKNYPTNVVKEDFQALVKNKHYNNASVDVAKVLSKNDEITKEYINVFLNVLSMYITQKNRDESEPFDVNCTKQDVKLNLNPSEINDCAEKICNAIDRALFFFQTRCGIRTISDINYKAQLEVIAYFFTDDDLFKDRKVHLFFEYWYWISIFAYMYPSNQNIAIYSEIEKFEKYFKNRKKNNEAITYLKKYQADVLNKTDYSDKDTLIFSDIAKKTPPAIMTKYICQYYLAIGYSDFWDSNILINFLYEDDLDIHHLMPLGSDPIFKGQKISIGETTKTLRNQKENPYNSPLNMLFITKASNKRISDMEYQTYSQDKGVLNVIPNVDCLTTFDDSTTITTFIEERYKRLSARLKSRLDNLYSCLTD